MAPTLYMTQRSPPCRAVLMTAKAIGLVLNEKEVDVLGGELLKPEFLKINPQHTIPTLVDDDGFVLWDSHAILAYLVSKYATNDSLYPKDLQKRAVIDQRLHFNGGVIFEKLKQTFGPILYGKKHGVDEEDVNSFNEGYGFLESFLEGKQWLAGDSISIADYALITVIISLNAIIPVDPEKFPKVVEWIKKCQELPEYEVNAKGLQEIEDMLKKVSQKD